MCFIMSLPDLPCLFVAKVTSDYLEKSVFFRLLTCKEESAAPEPSAQRPEQSTQLWAPAFPPNVGLWFENWIWAVSVLMRMQAAHQGEEPQREWYENISILILKYSGTLNICTALLLLTISLLLSC